MATAAISNVQFTGMSNQAVSFTVTTTAADGETVVDVMVFACLPEDVPSSPWTVPNSAIICTPSGDNTWIQACLTLPTGTGQRTICAWPIVRIVGTRGTANVTIPG